MRRLGLNFLEVVMQKEGEYYKHFVPEIELSIERNTGRVPADGKFHILKADILLVQINWQSKGYFYFITVEVQIVVFEELGKDRYFRLPKEGTNPRGVEFSKEAILRLQNEPTVKQIEIKWKRPETGLSLYDAYRRWVDYWREE